MKKIILAICLVLCYNSAYAKPEVRNISVFGKDVVQCVVDNVKGTMSCNWDDYNERKKQREKEEYYASDEYKDYLDEKIKTYNDMYEIHRKFWDNLLRKLD